MPIPIKFGGVPIGVPMPPIDAPNAAISIIAIANSRLADSDSRPCVRCATIDRPIGYIMAVVAVLLIHIEMPAVTPPNTRRMRTGLRPTSREDRALNAIRRSRPWTNIASASMKLPMNRKMMGSAKGANAVRAGATRSTTASTGPISAVTASGSASVIQRTTIIARMAASRWAGAASGSGAAISATSSAGPRNNPTVRRRRLNCSSAGE